MLRAEQRRSLREHNERMVLAWHIAALSRVDPKKFPKLDKLMQRGRRNRRPMTPEQQWRVMSALAAASPKTTRN